MKNSSNINLIFQEVFGVVVIFTLISGAGSFWIASQPSLSSQQERILECSTATWQAGVGVLFGLIGSKVTEISQHRDCEDEDDR